MGGGGKAPKTPDYTPVIDSIKKALNFTQQQAENALGWATNAYKQNKGVSDTYINSALGLMPS